MLIVTNPIEMKGGGCSYRIPLDMLFQLDSLPQFWNSSGTEGLLQWTHQGNTITPRPMRGIRSAVSLFLSFFVCMFVFVSKYFHPVSAWEGHPSLHCLLI